MTTAIQKATDPKKDIRNYVQSDQVKKQIAMVLPKHLTADVMARVVCTAILKTPRLAECSIESLLQSIMLLSQFGLLPDGRSAHLIPYFNSKANRYDCQAIIDWKGKVARATENGVENICADVVCFNDKFTWKMTPDGLQFDHEIDFRTPDRGAMFAAYVVWKHGGKFSGAIMSKMEIDAIRKRSKSPDKGPWQTDYSEMAKKTVVHRASKLWPLDAEFNEAIEVQEVREAAIDLSPLPMPEVIEDSPDKKAIQAPAVESPSNVTAEETPRQFVCRMLDEADVAFDDTRSFIQLKNIAADVDSWASMDDVPDAAFESLKAQPKAMAELIRKFGKAKA